MSYCIKLTPNAIEQIQAALDYISDVLMVPDIAENWKNRLKNDVSQLSFMPGRVRLTEEEPWHGLGIHKLIVHHFIIYFWIEETVKIVWITAIVYEKRDQISVLGQMPLE